MPYYLLQAAYTSEAWATQIKAPGNRIEQLRSAVEGLGGKIESAYYMFGEYDIVATIQFPDNQSAAAFSLAASAGGGVKAINTTPLMTIEEGMEAMRKAGGSSYKPPGS
ncbi:MAG: GYD domain-containing protein [Chloroflexi bacterium]|nr:GYD domain-containing protein [Chloroflexota bacterium]